MNKRQKIYKVLKLSKQFLSSTATPTEDQELYICYAINGYCMLPYSYADLATDEIMRRLRGHYSAEMWLRNTIGDTKVDEALKTNPNAIQEWRHRWLDSLIEEFSQ